MTLDERVQHVYHRLILIHVVAASVTGETAMYFSHELILDALAELAMEAAEELSPLTVDLPVHIAEYEPEEDGKPEEDVSVESGAR
jgi:hypothetical protein